MTYISHFRFQPDPQYPRFEQASLDEYQATRRHPNRPIKDRRLMDFPPVELTASRAEFRQTHAENLQFIRGNPQSRTVTLFANSLAKVVGYNSEEGDTVATTGTSKLNTLCITDGFGPCIGVAIGGEKFDRRGRLLPGSKVRIFHVFPRNATSREEIGLYVQKLQSWGLTVRAAMHGGDVDSQRSVGQSRRLRALFSAMNVWVDFDETCERRFSSQPMGVIIHNNHAVQFVTELEQSL
jgi:hypothetical protein